MDVLEGDILAAYLPTLVPPILLVGNDTQGRLYLDTRDFDSQFTVLRLSKGSLSVVENHVMHLYADVGKYIIQKWN